MFLIFGGEAYYSSGGGYDLLGKDKIQKEACAKAERYLGGSAVTEIAEWSDNRGNDMATDIEWVHVVDGNTGEIVAVFGEKPYGGGHPVIEVRETE